MRRWVGIGLVVLSSALVVAPATAQVGSGDEDPPAPVETTVTEATRTVGTAAQYRTALTDLSALTTGSHTIRITADFTLNADNEPTYTGTRPLVIAGQGHTIGGNDANRLVDHQSTARLTVRNLTFTDGESGVSESGGAVRALGPVTIDNTTFTSGDAVQNGGALEVAGNLTITDSTFTGNISGFGNGGAIHASGALSITDSRFEDNEAAGTDGGGAVFHDGTTATLTRVTFEGNSATENGADGGALRLDTTGTVTLTDVTAEDNQVLGGDGGAVAVTDQDAITVVDGGTFTGNRSASPGVGDGGALSVDGGATIAGATFAANGVQGGGGGAVALGDGTASTIRDATFTQNQTISGSGGVGGAVRVQDADETFLIDGSTFTGNLAGGTSGRGGAVSLSQGTVEDSTFDDNTATGRGGAVDALGGALVTIRRSVFTGNEVTGVGGDGGALSVEDVTVEASSLHGNHADEGGALFVNHEGTVADTTVTDNTADDTGGGILVDGGADLALTHVTLAANQSPTGANLATKQDVGLTTEASVLTGPALGADCAFGATNTLVSNGANVESATSCQFTQPSDHQGSADPGLGPLRTNGGTSPSHYPLAGSILVDAIQPGDCTSNADQRGVDRPFGAGCDIGAVEQVYPDHPFSDVPGWVEDTVRWIGSTVNDPQIMTGITPTTFEPDDPITRAQVTRLLYNEAGAPDVTGTPAHPFTDVPAWVDDAVTWAHDLGIVTGITPTTFVPDDPITRAQVTRMKYRFAGSPDVAGIDPHPFTDVPAWVDDAVRWAADTDNPLPLATGITPTTFVPDDPITRAQVARMDYRLALTPGAWDDPDAASHQMLFQSNLF